jgi:hypothetical protein
MCPVRFVTAVSGRSRKSCFLNPWASRPILGTGRTAGSAMINRTARLDLCAAGLPRTAARRRVQMIADRCGPRKLIGINCIRSDCGCKRWLASKSNAD